MRRTLSSVEWRTAHRRLHRAVLRLRLRWLRLDRASHYLAARAGRGQLSHYLAPRAGRGQLSAVSPELVLTHFQHQLAAMKLTLRIRALRDWLETRA